MKVSKPTPQTDMVCPFHKAPMKKVCPKCPLFVAIKGKPPQSDEVIDRWGCAFEFMPMLTIENSQQQRGTQHAVESFRNEVSRAGAAIAQHVVLNKMNGAPNGPAITYPDRNDHSR